MSLGQAINTVRESVVAILRIRKTRPETTRKGKVEPAQFNVGWGSGFVLVRNRYVMTAFHILNDGQTRNPDDNFLALVVPNNGDPAFHFPIIGFPIERPDLDLAVLEIGPCATPGVQLPSLPVSFAAHTDGTRVLTMGFPSPEVAGIHIDTQGAYLGGQFFLKSHANEGIVSAQYPLGPMHVYEFNVGWHHGESGGPVVRLDNTVAVFTIMQQYRNVKSPHGTVAGPHRGCALTAIQQEISALGATIV